MWFTRSYEPASASLAERYNSAQALHASAISVFHEIATQLDEAAGYYDTVAAEAQEEITRLQMIRNEALDSGAKARTSTASVLSLTRGIPT